MAHTQEILDYVSEWQTKRFRESEITLTDAAESLHTENPLVAARPVPGTTRWALFNTETKKVAVIAHAGIWGWKCDLVTGNFVPEGCDAPEGLPEGRIQDTPSYRCEFSYAFDTSVDASIWDHLQSLEDHVSAQPGFNKGGRPRRAWQSGKNPTLRQKYIMTSKVFARRTPLNSKEDGEYDVPYEVHPWLMHAVDNFPEAHQIPNPDRPKYYDYTDKVLRKLEDTNNPTFHKNDIVWMSFRVAFVVSGESWWSEIIPIEFVRVGKVPDHLVTKFDTATFPPLDADFEHLETGAPLDVIDGPSRPLKRKVSEEPLQVSATNKNKHMDVDSSMTENHLETQETATKRAGSGAGGNSAAGGSGVGSGSKTRSRVGKENKFPNGRN